MKNIIKLIIILVVVAFIGINYMDSRNEKKYKKCTSECLFIRLEAKGECEITCLKKYK